MKTAKILIIIAVCVFTALANNTAREFSSATAKSKPLAVMASEPPVATFSIVAFDPNTEELGIAVQSKFIAVGSVVPWAKAPVGAIATQAYANTKYGPQAIKLLEQGLDPNDVIKKLTADDSGAPSRQIGIVDAKGRSATFTGPKCNKWAGGRAGMYYAVQGNILTGPEVVDAMAKAFEKAKGELALRMLDSLEAGQLAGGDSRGKQSAALFIVREGWGYAGYNDRYRDLRVDDNPEPIKELRRIYELHKAVFPQPKLTEKKK